MAKRRKSESVGSSIIRSLKEFTEALEAGENIQRRFTCRTVRLKIKPRNYTPTMVKKTRAVLDASQAVFAMFLGVSPSAVQDWEQGAKTPQGSARRLMDEIRNNPEYWRQRLRELAEPVEA